MSESDEAANLEQRTEFYREQWVDSSNDLGALRRNSARIETQPVHAAKVTCVLDFQAAVHHNVESGLRGDICTRLTDHAIL